MLCIVRNLSFVDYRISFMMSGGLDVFYLTNWHLSHIVNYDIIEVFV